MEFTTSNKIRKTTLIRKIHLWRHLKKVRQQVL